MTMTKKNLRIAMLAMGLAIGICGGNAVKAAAADTQQHAAPAAIEHAAPSAYTQTSDAGVGNSSILAVVDSL